MYFPHDSCKVKIVLKSSYIFIINEKKYFKIILNNEKKMMKTVVVALKYNQVSNVLKTEPICSHKIKNELIAFA